jgi:hypothetical protein
MMICIRFNLVDVTFNKCRASYIYLIWYIYTSGYSVVISSECGKFSLYLLSSTYIVKGWDVKQSSVSYCIKGKANFGKVTTTLDHINERERRSIAITGMNWMGKVLLVG